MKPYLTIRHCLAFLLLALCCFWPACSVQALDVFDRHAADLLHQAIEGKAGAKSLSQAEASKLKPLAKNLEGSCIVVETSSGNLAKALISWGFRKTSGGAEQKVVPVLMLDRFVTYERGKGDSTVANGKNVMLFPGFGFDFDLGQVVPEGFDADVEFTAKGILQCLGQAQLHGVNGSQIPAEEEAPAKKAGTPNNDSEKILPEDFTGVWKVDGDGRWLGEWDLTVNEDGQASGKFFSAESQASYPITGQIAALPHQIKLQIQFNNATQIVEAFLWTKDKSTIAGSFTLAGRKFGLHATRQTAK
ncbi:MAG: hypothetical protein JWM11_5929 [Planctomycetaceae bacterium]|nr:hypothetical protein [Planctomycetaceae bacterium]